MKILNEDKYNELSAKLQKELQETVKAFINSNSEYSNYAYPIAYSAAVDLLKENQYMRELRKIDTGDISRNNINYDKIGDQIYVNGKALNNGSRIRVRYEGEDFIGTVSHIDICVSDTDAMMELTFITVETDDGLENFQLMARYMEEVELL